MTHLDALDFQNGFASLPPAFYTRLQATPLPDPYLVCASPSAAALIGLDLDAFSDPAVVAALTGNQIPTGAAPLAAVYSGHQFGVWAGQLGDGRAILLGDVAAETGRLELQLKGAGPTPYSRMGDGRAVLRSSIREFLCSEAMAGLGIPTSRALCVTGSDHRVMREAPEPTAVTTRLAPSFVRFGSLEHWSARGQDSELKQLADYLIQQFYPELASATNPYAALLAEVCRRTAVLIAHWQSVGFMHGVMNTDNMSMLGLTIDYGPFGFMEAYDADHICNHTDSQGRYAYSMQTKAADWNCHALAQAMLPLIGDLELTKAAVAVYQTTLVPTLSAFFQRKLGLSTTQSDDRLLQESLFSLLQANRVDFTLFFRRLGNLQLASTTQDAAVRDLFLDRPAFDHWATLYRARLAQEGSLDAARKLAMDAVNPKYVLRNYLAQIAIQAAENKDFSEVQTLLSVLAHPYDEQMEHASYAALPPDWANTLEVSCSS